MKILLSNDDGIHAAGIKALAEELAKKHKVYVVAPNRERSAMSHAITLNRPLRLVHLDNNFFAGVKAVYTCDGTPADCTKLGLNKLLDFKPDLIVAGINNGPNLGMDIMYSGTVSAAAEGLVQGIKSIAFSHVKHKESGYEQDAVVACETIEALISKEHIWKEKTLFNVNLPDLIDGEHKGIYITNLGHRMYTDQYEKRQDPRFKDYYWISGNLIEMDQDPDSDVVKCRDGYVSITPITLSFVKDNYIQTLKEEFPN